MLPEIKKILFATDLSENAKHAFKYAATMANKFDAELTVLHVLEDFSANTESMLVEILGEERWRELQERKIDDCKDIHRKRLESFCEEANSEFSDCPYIVRDFLVIKGNPVEVILEEAESGGFDLIVMGAHGLGFLAGALIGSTSRRVLRKCLKPVMVIRLPEEER